MCFRYRLVLLIGLCTATPAAASSWADALFEELYRDFGSVPRGPVMNHSFRLTNKTQAPVHIAGVRVSCGCVTAAPMQYDLAPGQSTTILAQMDTRRFTGIKSVTIYVQFDRPQWEEVRLVVQANCRDDVTLSPESLSFGAMKRGTSPCANVNISFVGNNQWQIVSAQSESNYVIPTIKEVRRDMGEVVYQLSARIRQDVPIGKWYTDIWLKTNNATTPRVRVPLTVEVESALSVSPPVALIDEVKTGGMAERKVIVRGAKPFRITGVKGLDGQLSVQGFSKESKPIHVLTLTLKPTRTGEQQWNLRILTDMKEDGEIDFHAKAQVVP